MSPTWKMLNAQEQEPGKPPSIWWYAVGFVVMLIVGIAIGVSTWDEAGRAITGGFLIPALVLPLLIWGAFCGVVYSFHEFETERVDYWNFLCRLALATWQESARRHIAVIDSAALTPEPELAERMLGLEGSAPMNPGKTMALPEMEVPTGASRLGLIIEQLIRPLAGRISQITRTNTFEVLLQSADEHDLYELQAAWKNLNLPNHACIGWIPLDAKQTKIEHWFDDERQCDFKLVIACQLHAGQHEPSCSEAAVALLLASGNTVKKSSTNLKPQARLFRPISTPPASVLDALETLLAAEQTPRPRIGHLWLSGLPRQGHHATTAAVKATGLDVSTHDIDHAIGQAGPMNALLLLALAAQMVEHGQGAQLVASPCGEGVLMNLVGTQTVPVPRVEGGYVRLLNSSACIAMACCFAAVMLGLETLGASAWWFWGWFAAYVLLFVLQMICSRTMCRVVEQDFYTQDLRSMAPLIAPHPAIDD